MIDAVSNALFESHNWMRFFYRWARAY